MNLTEIRVRIRRDLQDTDAAMERVERYETFNGNSAN